MLRIPIWLVVWLPFFIFPYIGKFGNNHPNWLSYFSEGWPNHQPVMVLVLHYIATFNMSQLLCFLRLVGSEWGHLAAQQHDVPRKDANLRMFSLNRFAACMFSLFHVSNPDHHPLHANSCGQNNYKPPVWEWFIPLIPPIKMVMTGGWLIIVSITWYQHYESCCSMIFCQPWITHSAGCFFHDYLSHSPNCIHQKKFHDC